MTLFYNRKEKEIQRKGLRKNLTPEEAIMWNILRRYFKEQRFRRQYSLGSYILDFYSPRYRIAIEIDGEQHLENENYDRRRDSFIKSFDIKILRFWNRDMHNNLEGVVLKISQIIKS